MPLTNSQYNELQRMYDARQLENHHEYTRRKKAIYSKITSLSEIDSQIASTALAHATALMDNNLAEAESLKSSLAELKSKKYQILQEHGYTPEDLEMHYTCPDCQDTGYINGQKCHCFTQASINLVYSQSNIQNVLEKENFDTYSYEYYSEDSFDPSTGLSSLVLAKRAVITCKQFIDNFSNTFQNLCLYGEAGSGKTFLSNCVAKELLDKGYSVLYFTSFQFFEIFEKYTFDQENKEKEAHQNIFDCDLLIIDDLGSELVNSFTSSRLFLCLNERILHKKSTLISTNLSMEDLSQIYSEKITSRIFGNYDMIKLYSDDIRIKKKLS